MARVVEIAASVDDPLLKARAWMVQATHVQDTGGDLGLGTGLLKQAEEAVFPTGPYRLQRTTLNSLGMVAFRMGRLDDALAVFRKLDDLAASKREGSLQATARSNILNTAALKESLLPTPGGKQQLIRLAERALATALAAEKSGPTAKIHRALAELLANEEPIPGNGAPACGELPGAGHRRFACRTTKRSAPGSRRRSFGRAIPPSLTQPSSRLSVRPHGRTARGPRPTAPAGACGSAGIPRRDQRPSGTRLPRLMRSRRLRSLQDDAGSSAELFSTWTSDYYFLAGRLLQTSQEGDLELRSRSPSACARGRCSTRWDGRGPPTELAHPAVVEGARSSRRIAAVQRRLMDPTIDNGERRKSLAKLEGLELEEREVHARSPCAPLTAIARVPRSPVSAPFSRRLPTTRPCCRFRSGCGKRSRESSAAAHGSWC